MLINTDAIQQIYIVCGKTDLLRGIDGLAAVVQEQFELDPYNQSLYLFVAPAKTGSRRSFWDGDVFLLLYKRLEDGRLQWPVNQAAIRKLSYDQFSRLLSGWLLDATIHQFTPPKPLKSARHSNQAMINS